MDAANAAGPGRLVGPGPGYLRKPRWSGDAAAATMGPVWQKLGPWTRRTPLKMNKQSLSRPALGLGLALGLMGWRGGPDHHGDQRLDRQKFAPGRGH